ncbi:MAG: hypothetical protein H6Q63_190 [Firmicutes bacterium]|nr:hypothetical protein [Bacillota bacterium]
METLSRKLLGYYRYYGITDNREIVKNFLVGEKMPIKFHIESNDVYKKQKRFSALDCAATFWVLSIDVIQGPHSYSR